MASLKQNENSSTWTGKPLCGRNAEATGYAFSSKIFPIYIFRFKYESDYDIEE